MENRTEHDSQRNYIMLELPSRESKKDLGTRGQGRMRKDGEKIRRLQDGKRGHEVLGTKLVTSMKNVLLKGLGCPLPS